MNGLASFSVKVAAVDRKHRRAIEVNRPYLRLSGSSLVVTSARRSPARKYFNRQAPVCNRVVARTPPAQRAVRTVFIHSSFPFGNDFLNYLFWIATTQERIILIILSPIKDVAVITLRRSHVFSDFPEIAFAQLKNVPSYPIALRSRVAGKQFDNTIQLGLLKLLANTLEGALLHTFNDHHHSTAILAVAQRASCSLKRRISESNAQV